MREPTSSADRRRSPPYEADIFAWSSPTGSLPVSITSTVQFADVTGDGQDELCWASGADVVCKTNLATESPNTCWGFDDSNLMIVSFPASISVAPKYASTLGFPDLDNDNDADVCVRLSDGIHCAVSTGTGFLPQTRWLKSFTDFPGGWGAEPYYSTIDYPDIDGNGMADVCGRSSTGIVCSMSYGSGFGVPQLRSQGSDFSDGDGWNQHPSHYETVQFADIDGDGDDDVCGRSNSGIYCAEADHLLREFGAGDIWTPEFDDWWDESRFATIQFGDVNGDGMADICGRDDDGVHCGVSLGNAVDGFVEADNLDVPPFSTWGGWDQELYFSTIVLTDIDGDGADDVCGRGVAGVHCARSKGFWAGWLSGWTDLFHPTELWIDQFGDVDGWGSQEQYWGTVQPTNVVDAFAGDEFCGVGAAGVWCSYR